MNCIIPFHQKSYLLGGRNGTIILYLDGEIKVVYSGVKAVLDLIVFTNNKLLIISGTDYSEIDEVCCVALSRVDSIFAIGYTDPASGVPGGLVPGSDFPESTYVLQGWVL